MSKIPKMAKFFNNVRYPVITGIFKEEHNCFIQVCASTCKKKHVQNRKMAKFFTQKNQPLILDKHRNIVSKIKAFFTIL
jgi:hypothetical protein